MSAGRVSAASKEQVRERADLVELVRARVELRRAGAEWTGRCPFHDERTPSFWVNPVEKVYYCFGCGARGDVIRFVQESQQLDFPEALEWLAERYGVELEYERASPGDAARRVQRERRRGLLELAASFYERSLHDGAAAERARAYLAARGLGDEVVRRFRLGYAPDAWDRVARGAAQRGYSEQELAETGLAGRARGGQRSLIDRFRDRLMFPLCDGAGHVVGFGARRLPPSEDGPKYLNSPEGPLFRKRDLLYGLHLAKAEIARADRAIVVEGYTDVLALSQAGIANAVASMGTALTERQLAELAKLSRNVVLCFDADAAGAEAALAGMRLATSAGLDVRVALLPAGSDPADLAGEDVAALRSTLDSGLSVLAFRVAGVLDRADLSAPPGRDRALAELRPVFAEAPPSIERDELVSHVASRLRLPVELEQQLRRGPRRGAARAAAGATATRARLDPEERDERLLLAFCLASGARGAEVLERLGPDAFVGDGHAEARGFVLRRLRGLPPAEGDEALASELEPELIALAAREGGEPALDEKAANVELRAVERRIEPLKVKLAGDDITREEARELATLQSEAQRLQEQATRPH